LLKSKLLNNNKLEKELKSFHDRNIQLEKEIQRLAGDILEIHRKYNDEKRKKENLYNEEIKNLKLENEKYKSKIEMVNELAREKNGILKAFDNVLQERNAILIEHDKMIREKEINNEIKVSNLKKKMIDSVNEAKSKVDELNAECLDNTTKLIYLQNSQLLLKIEYQTQHLNKLNEKNQELENKINELKKDIQIHREVEISLA
jgi:cell division protein FtsB